MKRKIKKYLIPIILIVSLLANVIYFWLIPAFNRYKQELINKGIVYVFVKAKELGSVRLNLEDETIQLQIVK